MITLDNESELGREGNDQDKEKRKGQVLKWMVEEEIVTSNTHFQRKGKKEIFVYETEYFFWVGGIQSAKRNR